MQKNNWPYTLTIAGFDPSGGAGLLADIKTMEQHQVYGFGVCTALTVQNDVSFQSVDWQSFSLIEKQLNLLICNFSVNFCKIGLVENWEVLNLIIDYLQNHNPNIRIVLDPIFRASAGFEFHEHKQLKYLEKIFKKIYLITPNLPELEAMAGGGDSKFILNLMSKYCHVLLKGGHHLSEKGTDYLYYKNQVIKLKPSLSASYEKHGSGCVLSAAIVSNLAKGYSLAESCRKAKIYMANFLDSNSSLLGYHFNL